MASKQTRFHSRRFMHTSSENQFSRSATPTEQIMWHTICQNGYSVFNEHNKWHISKNKFQHTFTRRQNRTDRILAAIITLCTLLLDVSKHIRTRNVNAHWRRKSPHNGSETLRPHKVAKLSVARKLFIWSSTIPTAPPYLLWGKNKTRTIQGFIHIMNKSFQER
jgi:hypothetical protein